MSESPSTPAISLQRIDKQFGGVNALAGASFEVEAGTVHGLVGQNGAGKSTLMKILAGLHQPDGGSIEIHGERQKSLDPRKVEQLGIQFIHQDRLLVPSFTVGEALSLGDEIRTSRFLPLLDRRAMRHRAEATLRTYFDLDLPSGTLIRDLTTAQKQIVQITRALLKSPKILVFDEPTAALVRREADLLFGLIRRLSADGITIIYISHYLSEIEDLCDKVTVLRNGVDVGTVDPRTTPAATIASLMIERDLDDMFPKQPVAIGEARLAVSNLSLTGRFDDVSFEIGRGEIVGLTGLLGSGAKDLIRVLFGLDRADSGSIALDGAPYRPSTPVEAVDRGGALVPEDRRGHGLALALDVAENTTLASHARISKAGILLRRAEQRIVDDLIARLSIRTPDRTSLVRTLSGGNQQKVVLAKWLSRQSNLYILDEPTVGIDIGSKVEIYTLIGDLAATGAAILILSTDLPELIGITDRILVMYRGRLIETVRTSDVDADAILALATGASEVRHDH